MSIFGSKKKNVQENQIDKEQLYGRIVKKVNEKLTEQINHLFTRQLTTGKAEQQNLLNSFSTLNTEFEKVSTEFDKVKNKRIITIWAERAGPLRSDEMLSFGNGGREEGVGYPMTHDGRILKMGLSTTHDIDVEIFLMVNDKRIVSFKKSYNPSLGIVVQTVADGKEDNGDPLRDTQIKFQANPFAVEETFRVNLHVKAGDIIGFKSNSDNNNAKNTIVCALIELNIRS